MVRTGKQSTDNEEVHEQTRAIDYSTLAKKLHRQRQTDTFPRSSWDSTKEIRSSCGHSFGSQQGPLHYQSTDTHHNSKAVIQQKRKREQINGSGSDLQHAATGIPRATTASSKEVER